jgi:glutamate-1-semialdehyde 2,1-aminomutase
MNTSTLSPLIEIKPLSTESSERLFAEAKTLFPGGVNSPVRAFKSVGGTPRFMAKGEGAFLTDADGNRYLDFCGSWGPLILGHAHPAIESAVIEALKNGASFGAPTALENALGALVIQNHPAVERMRFVSSGTEAVMSALRLARGITGKSKILKFEGCYHGHVDALLVKAGSGLVTFGQSGSAGVSDAVASETLVVDLNNLEALQEAFRLHAHELACVIIEPIPANNGLLLQEGHFLQKLRELCSAHGVLLIFDEVISGFRVAFGGAAERYGIMPDLLCFGKILGGGLPVGAYGGKKEYMAHISPEGPVYQAGTLSGNPLSMAAGAAQLTELIKPGFYQALETKTATFVQELNEAASGAKVPFKAWHIGSIFWMAFTNEPVFRSSDKIAAPAMTLFGQLYHQMLAKGLYFGPSGYEVGFINAAQTPEELSKAAAIIGGLVHQLPPLEL